MNNNNNNNSIILFIANMLNHCYFQYNTQEHCSKYDGSVLYVFIKLCGWSVHTVSIVKHIQYSLATGNSPRNYKAVIELENIYIINTYITVPWKWNRFVWCCRLVLLSRHAQPNFYLPCPFTFIFSKFSPYSLTALVLANAASCVGLQNKIDHPAHSHKQFKQVVMVRACRI